MTASVKHTKVTAIADDPTKGDVLASDWNADHDLTEIATLGANTFTGAQTIASGTLTASAPAVDVTQTWNDSGTTFVAQSVNVTNTASASGSLLADWKVGGVSKAKIYSDGVIEVGFHGADGSPGLRAGYEYCGFGWMNDYQPAIWVSGARVFGYNHTNAVAIAPSNFGYGWTSVSDSIFPNDNADTALNRGSAGVVEVNNGTAGGVGYIKTPATTVGALIAAATVGAGTRAFVTDANATTFLSVAAGGGSNKVPVVSDGTNWLIG